MKKSEIKSFYDVLGVSQNATNDIIRSAYLQKAKESHPDKMMNKNNNNETENENENKNKRCLDLNQELEYFNGSNESTFVESTFVEVKAAYDVLSNPHKRFIYDNQFDTQFDAFFSSKRENTSGEESLSFADISDLYDKFMSFVTIASHIIKKRREDDNDNDKNESSASASASASCCEKEDENTFTFTSDVGIIAPINVRVKASLSDFYYGHIKTVLVTISKIDFQTETETFEVPLDIDEKMVEFRGRGDEYLFYKDDGSCTIARGSVIVNIDVEEDSEIQHYTLFSNHDLLVEISINLYDYIFGKSFSIFIFDEKVKIRYRGGKPTTMIVENKGLPLNGNKNDVRGRCFVCLDLNLPEKFDALHMIRSNSDDPFHNEVKMFKILCKKYLS